MADRWAVLIAVETYLHPAVAPAPYTEADADALAAALPTVGFPAANHVVLKGQYATKAAIESRLRRLKRQVRKGDELLVILAGRGFSRNGKGYLAGWDALPDDLPDTSVPIADLLGTLAATKAARVAVLLDIGRGAAVAGADAEPQLDEGELTRLFADSPKLVALASGRPDETAHAASALKHGVFARLLLDVLAGKAPKAAAADGRVSAVSLSRHLEAEMPRLLRKHFDADAAQTPSVYGQANAGETIFDLAHILNPAAGAVLDAGRLRRIVFRSETPGKVKDLAGFRKTFQLPDKTGPSARKFVARVAEADVRADLQAAYDAARDGFGYKRKDLDLSAVRDGYGFLRTPDFEYSVSAAQDQDDPARVVWRREMAQIADPALVRDPAFDAAFGRRFDRLVFEFTTPVDVPALVDRIEDSPPPGVKVSITGDGTACDITLAGFAGTVRVDRHALTVRGRSGTSAGLLDQFLEFIRKFGPLGEPLALPAAPGR